MSKELECLEKLGTHRIEYKEGFELGFTKTMPFKNTTEYKIIKQSLLEKQELEKKLEKQNELLKKLGFKDEYTFKKIMQIMVDNVFYDDRGERYETPSLYYDNGLCIIDSETGGCGVGIENYGKAFAREFEEIER